MCEKKNVLAVAKSPDVDGGSVQSHLSSFVVKTTWVAPWNQEGLLSHLCEWIVLDDQVHISLYVMLYILIYNFQSFSVIEKESFKVLLNYQHLSVTDEIYTKSILVFVNQVCSLPQACMWFQKLFQEENLPPLQLLKGVHTH